MTESFDFPSFFSSLCCLPDINFSYLRSRVFGHVFIKELNGVLFILWFLVDLNAFKRTDRVDTLISVVTWFGIELTFVDIWNWLKRQKFNWESNEIKLICAKPKWKSIKPAQRRKKSNKAFQHLHTTSFQHCISILGSTYRQFSPDSYIRRACLSIIVFSYYSHRCPPSIHWCLMKLNHFDLFVHKKNENRQKSRNEKIKKRCVRENCGNESCERTDT